MDKTKNETLKSKIIPYGIYVLTMLGACLNAWIESRDPEAESWHRFAFKNKQVLVTNLIIDPSTRRSDTFVAVEITGCNDGEKRVLSAQSRRIVKMPFIPQMGETLTLTVEKGLVQVEGQVIRNSSTSNNLPRGALCSR